MPSTEPADPATPRPIMLRPDPDLDYLIDWYAGRGYHPQPRAIACYELLRLGLALHQFRGTTEPDTPERRWLDSLYASARVQP